uniref:Uncharacterized protein n=1 Tax=Caenorhabditis japonica TaxID=281687 RepID=A0A8R1EQY2_CAEJA
MPAAPLLDPITAYVPGKRNRRGGEQSDDGVDVVAVEEASTSSVSGEPDQKRWVSDNHK